VTRNGRLPQILLVEHRPEVARRFLAAVAGMVPAPVCRHVTGVAGAAEALRAVIFDLVVLDVDASDGTGPAGLELVRDLAFDTPTLLLGGEPVDVPVDPWFGDEGPGHIRDEDVDERVLPHVLGGALARARLVARARESDHRFAQFIDAIPLGVCIVDAVDGEPYVNPQALRILGPEAARILAEEHPDFALAPGRGRPRFLRDGSPVRRALAGDPLHHESAILEGAGRRWVLALDAFPLAAPTGKVEYAAVLVHDVTERRRMEQQIRNLARMDAMGALAASVAHDFNNLLSVIGTFAYLALDELPAEMPARADVEEIVKATARSQEMVAKLLNFAREEAAIAADTDLNELLGSLRRVLGRLVGAGVTVELDLDPGVPRASLPAGELEEVIINLAVNARDAMPAGGRLVLTTRVVDDDPVAPIRLTVRDSGIGMDAATLGRIFEPLFTTKGPGKGTGLGLPSVRTIVEAHGGRVEVRSTLGEGTEFTLALARAAGDAPREAASAPGRVAKADAPRVLVVDDDEFLRGVVTRQVSQLGYRVLDAIHAEGALARVAAGESFDLLLTDVDMPGLSGIELAGMLRASRPDLPVIFMTGYEAPEVGAAESVLLKPFVASELATALRLALPR
jgi:hypothetical protein